MPCRRLLRVTTAISLRSDAHRRGLARGGRTRAGRHHAGHADDRVTPTSGPDSTIVFPRKTDSKIVYTVRSAGVWSVPVPIRSKRPFRGIDCGRRAAGRWGDRGVPRHRTPMVYASRYTPNGVPAWSAPAAIAAPNVSTPSSPAIAPGIGGADAELVYVDAPTGAVKHTRLTGAVWSAADLDWRGRSHARRDCKRSLSACEGLSGPEPRTLARSHSIRALSRFGADAVALRWLERHHHDTRALRHLLHHRPRGRLGDHHRPHRRRNRRCACLRHAPAARAGCSSPPSGARDS